MEEGTGRVSESEGNEKSGRTVRRRCNKLVVEVEVGVMG